MTTMTTLVANHLEYNSHAGRLFAGWLATLDDSLVLQPTPMGTIAGVFRHISKAQEFWNLFLSGGDIQNFSWQEETNEPLTTYSRTTNTAMALENTCKQFTEEELLTPLPLHTSWADMCLPRMYYILHCVNHGTHHRAQIITLARWQGYQAAIPSTEYSLYTASASRVAPPSCK